MNSQEPLGPEWALFFRRTDRHGLLPWETVAQAWNRKSGESLDEKTTRTIGNRAELKIRRAINRDPKLRAVLAGLVGQP